MQQKKLLLPFSFEERRPLFIDDFFFYVPAYYFSHHLFGKEQFSHHPIFQRFQGKPVHFEFCSGNGEWILEKAKKNPEILWVAIEMRVDRVKNIWIQRDKLGLSNLLIVLGEGLTFIKHYVESQFVDRIYINFPDPWPKRRHQKHQFLKDELLVEFFRIVKRNGRVCLVTDDEKLSDHIVKLFSYSQKWSSLLPYPYKTYDFPYYGKKSFFEVLFRQKQKSIGYHIFQKKLK